jgi:hypothetical protein
MKQMDKLYDSAMKLMIESFDTLSQKLPGPKKCSEGREYFYRYEEKSIFQAILLKLAREVTGLQAVRLLNKAGFLQEQASLQRMVGEFQEDIMFLCFAIMFDDLTDLHKKYLDYFYLEEFDNPESAIKSSQKRPMVPRKKIFAYISKHLGKEYGQREVKEVIRTHSKTYSGYVHGASPHIMELYFGSPPRFHLQGAQKSPLYEDHVEDILNYFYRGILDFVFAAKSFGDEVLVKKIHTYSKEFALNSGRADDLTENL